MALPAYYTTGQRIWHRTYLVYCGIVLFLLVMPLIAVIHLSFTSSSFLDFTPEMLRLDPEAFSTRWYKMMVGECSAADITTVCSDKWVIGARNSLIIAVIATVPATAIGTVAALGLSRAHLVGRRAIMAFLISPMIVPLIITAAGMFLFYTELKLVASFTGAILAHTVLGQTGADHILTKNHKLRRIFCGDTTFFQESGTDESGESIRPIPYPCICRPKHPGSAQFEARTLPALQSRLGPQAQRKRSDSCPDARTRSR